MKLFTTFIFSLLGLLVTAQDSQLVQFFITQKKLTDTSAAVSITAKPAAGVKLFSITPASQEIPVNSTVMADSINKIQPLTAWQESGKAINAKDSALGTDVRYFTDSAVWTQNYATTDSVRLAFFVEAFVDNKGSLESVPRQTLKITLKPGTASGTLNTTATAQPEEKEKTGLTGLALTALLLGLAAVFTPCVFPLLPMTASFFTKKSKSKADGIRKAWLYAFFIIFIYTVPALLLVAFSRDPRPIYQISTSTTANLLFFAVFLIFAISFLGAFEITLPSSWTNAADSKAGGKNITGIFFMALTMVIVSFSCTGPFVSGMLVTTAQSGIGLAPVIGMLGFGVGFAVPFALMATFPNLLNSLPKSGGWLNSVKVVFGFIELALALKFFSGADQAQHWGILNRDLFIAAWVVLAILLGIYLLGKLHFSHDSPIQHINLFRFFLATASFVFAVWMLPGIWGAPLESLSGILPNPSTQQFNLYESTEQIKAKQLSGSSGNAENTQTVLPTKYTNLFKAPYGLTAFFDYEEGLAAAKKLNKPVMIDFTGHTCANCRKMEAGVWIDPAVQQSLRNDFVLIQLYVDDKTDLQDNEIYKDKQGHTITTLGNKNLDLEYNRFGDVSQPLYVFLDTNGEPLHPKGVGYSDVGTVEKFMTHLNQMKAAFEKR